MRQMRQLGQKRGGGRKERRGEKESNKERKEEGKQKKKSARVIGLRNEEISKIVID